MTGPRCDLCGHDSDVIACHGGLVCRDPGACLRRLQARERAGLTPCADCRADGEPWCHDCDQCNPDGQYLPSGRLDPAYA